MYLSKYGVPRTIYTTLKKRAVQDFAVAADWTPVAGDVKISKDGGAFANVSALPVAIASANTGATWKFALTASEMQAFQVVVVISDATTKAVEDAFFWIETYGNVSAQHGLDLATPTINPGPAGITSASFAAGALNAAAFNADTGLITRTGVAQAGSSTTITLDAAASAVSDFYNGMVAVITSGAGVGQHRILTSYNGTTKAATVGEAWVTNPDSSSAFTLRAGRAFVSAFIPNAINAASLATDAVTEIRDSIWGQTLTEPTTKPTFSSSALQHLAYWALLSLAEIDVTASQIVIRNIADSASVVTHTISDDGSQLTVGPAA